MLNSTKHKYIILINVKIPTTVGILIFIGMMNIVYESLKVYVKKSLYFSAFLVYEKEKFHAQMS